MRLHSESWSVLLKSDRASSRVSKQNPSSPFFAFLSSKVFWYYSSGRLRLLGLLYRASSIRPIGPEPPIFLTTTHLPPSGAWVRSVRAGRRMICSLFLDLCCQSKGIEVFSCPGLKMGLFAQLNEIGRCTRPRKDSIFWLPILY